MICPLKAFMFEGDKPDSVVSSITMQLFRVTYSVPLLQSISCVAVDIVEPKQTSFGTG